MIRLFSLLFVALTVSGCAIAGKQTREVLDLPVETLPRSSQIPDVPFINQTKNYCGPATLTMAMQFAGQNVTVDQLAPEVLTSSAKGSLQSDLISASRRRGMIAIPIEGMQPLVKEIAAGNPVIVLENRGFGWLPRWHYSIVYGYDLNTQELIMHSGHDANTRQYLNRFERGSKLAGYWGLVVLAPSKLSATGSVLDHLRAAAGLEQAERTAEADTAYKKILERWPDNLGGLIGVGNAAFKMKDYARARSHLKKAVKLYPDSQQAKHNLSVVEAAISQ